MKRALPLWLLLGCSLAAQEHAEAAGGGSHGDPWIWWKWANFGILAAVLGYLIAKHLPPFFRRRAAEIQQGIIEAQRLKQDAESKAAAMEQRMKLLGSEIERMHATAREEMAQESERIRRQTEAQMARVRQQAEQEINAAGRQARGELKTYAAQLAVELAEQRIRARLDADTENALVEGFARELERQGTRG